MSNWEQKKCVPCEGGVRPYTLEEAKKELSAISGWELSQDKKISKKYIFSNFVEAMKFINQVADLAEVEGHHPDIHIHYNEVTFVVWTHAINGLSDNDFILAAKTDQIHASL